MLRGWAGQSRWSRLPTSVHCASLHHMSSVRFYRLVSVKAYRDSNGGESGGWREGRFWGWGGVWQLNDVTLKLLKSLPLSLRTNGLF